MICTVLHPFSFPCAGKTVRAAVGEAVDIPDDQVVALARAGWIEPGDAPAAADPEAEATAEPIDPSRSAGRRRRVR